MIFLKQAMRRAGVTRTIQVVSDGQEAIDYLQGAGKFFDREIFPFPDLVLLELDLPYVMGLEVLKWIRQQVGSTLPVVMLSASAEPADITDAYRLGANAFLRKPSEPNQLEVVCKAIKDFWLTHNAMPGDGTSRRGNTPYITLPGRPTLTSSFGVQNLTTIGEG
jgi:CheY-like chemotaxis protein